MSDIEDRVERLESLVEQQQKTIEQQQETIADLRSEDSAASGGGTVTRRGAMKAAGLVGLLGAGAGAAAAGSSIGDPDDPVDTVYVNELDGGVTPDGTPVSSLAGDGLTVSGGAVGVDVGPEYVGAADDPHGNEAHDETFAVDGDAQPPESHGNEAHSKNFGAEGEPNTWTETNEFSTGLVVPNEFPNES